MDLTKLANIIYVNDDMEEPRLIISVGLAKDLASDSRVDVRLRDNAKNIVAALMGNPSPELRAMLEKLEDQLRSMQLRIRLEATAALEQGLHVESLDLNTQGLTSNECKEAKCELQRKLLRLCPEIPIQSLRAITAMMGKLSLTNVRQFERYSETDLRRHKNISGGLIARLRTILKVIGTDLRGN